ncbi:MAG: hypothetical protein ACK5LJ_09210 [Paracoccus sp. (in: a-proteobacteria)]
MAFIKKFVSISTRAESTSCSVSNASRRAARSSVIESLHQVPGRADGRGRQDQNKLKSGVPGGDIFCAPAATGAARKPASPRAILSPLRAGWRRIRAASDWLDGHWVGDLLGAICVFGIGIAVLIIAWGVQP